MRIRYILFVASLLLFALVPPVRGNPIDGNFSVVKVEPQSGSHLSLTPVFYILDDDFSENEQYSLVTAQISDTVYLYLNSSEGDRIYLYSYPAGQFEFKIIGVDVCSQAGLDGDSNFFSGLQNLVKPSQCPVISFMDRNIPFCSARDISAIIGSAFGLYLCIQLFV